MKEDVAKRIESIDGLRAIAILMVYLYHVWQFSGSPRLGGFGHWIDRMPAGVDLFMVLSGFCLFWPIARRPDRPWDWREYARRRIRRIVPPYYASILVMSLLPPLLVIAYRFAHLPANWQPAPSIWQYVTHLTFTHTFFPETWSGIQGCYWTLGLEAQFYLVFPICVWLFQRIGIWVTLPMVASSIAYRIVVGAMGANLTWTGSFLLTITFLGRWMEFAGGMLAAWIVARRAWMSVRMGWALALLAVIWYWLGAMSPAATVQLFPAREILLALAFGTAAVSVCSSNTLIRAILQSRLVVFCGLISYSVYLLHQNIGWYTAEFARRSLHLNGAARLAFMLMPGLPAIVALSYCFHWLFEKPFMRQKWTQFPWATRSSVTERSTAEPATVQSIA